MSGKSVDHSLSNVSRMSGFPRYRCRCSTKVINYAFCTNCEKKSKKFEIEIEERKVQNQDPISRSGIGSDPGICRGRSGGVGCFSRLNEGCGMRCVLRTYRTYRVEVICWWYGVKPIYCFYSKGGTYPNSYTVSPALYSHPGTCENVKIKIELKNLYSYIRSLSADGVRTSLPHSGLGLGLVGGLWVRCHLHPPSATQVVRQ